MQENDYIYHLGVGVRMMFASWFSGVRLELLQKEPAKIIHAEKTADLGYIVGT